MLSGGTKRNGYQQYLRMRKVLALFDEKGDVMKRDIVEILEDGQRENVANVILVLLKEKVIKLVSYNVDEGHRLAVYRRIKFE